MEWQLMTAEQKDITGLVRKFLENELAPLVQECDGVSRFPMEVFKKMGEIGLWGMDIPAEYGGPGFDLQTLSLLFVSSPTYIPPVTVHYSHFCIPIRFLSIISSIREI